MLLTALAQLSAILFGAALTVLVSCLMGRILQSLLREKLELLTRSEQRLFAFAIGSACLSGVVFLLSAARWVYSPVLLLLSAAVVTVSWRMRVPRPSFLKFAGEQKQPRIWIASFALIAITYGGLYLVHTLAPETRSDGVTYHLGLVRRYHNAHGFVPIVTSFYAALSQGAEMLYLFAYSFGRHSAAKLVHFSFFIATLAAMFAFARRYGERGAGIAAVILFACSPIIVPDATSSYNDCALAFHSFMLCYALLIWWRDQRAISAVTLGLLAGFCFALKYTGVIAFAALLPLMFWKWMRGSPRPREILRAMAVTTAAAGFLAAPWLIKNAIWLENPVAPFYNSLFPNPYFTPSWEQGYRAYFRTYTFDVKKPPLSSYPLELTYYGKRLGGLTGPIFLLTPLALLAWRKPVVRFLFAGAAISALPWLVNAGTRFLIPALVFISLALGFALCSLPPRLAAALGCVLLLAHAISSWPGVLPRWAGAVWAVEGIPWKAALRLEPERDFLLRSVPFFDSAEIINAQVAPADRVYSLEPLPEAYFDAELLVSYQGKLNQELFDALATPLDEDLLPSRRRTLRWQPQAMRGFRIVETNARDTPWRMSEIRLLGKHGDIARDPGWRISSEPQPWDAPRLFDGALVPGWQSWRDMRPGMRIEVRFPEPLTLTGAELVYPWGQHFVEFEYFGLTESGEWQSVAAQSEQSRAFVDPEPLKKWAVAQLTRNRVKLLITNSEGAGHNFIAPEIARNPAPWGLREIARDGPLRIYRILEDEINLPGSR